MNGEAAIKLGFNKILWVTWLTKSRKNRNWM